MPVILTLNPVAGLTVLVCLAAVALSIAVLRRLHGRRVRFIAGVLGINCVYQGMRLLHHGGYIHLPMGGQVEYLVDLTVTLLYLLGLVLLQLHGVERQCELMRLRLAEAQAHTSAAVENSRELMQLAQALQEGKGPVAHPLEICRQSPGLAQ